MIEEQNENELVDVSQCKLKFIDNSFYYINYNTNFIYDKETLEKVGYINDNEYIFECSLPFN